MFAVPICVVVASLAPQQPIQVHLVDVAPVARTTIVTGTLPFAPGELRLPAPASGGHTVVDLQMLDGEQSCVVPARPLWTWPDGSAGAVQFHARVGGAPGGERAIAFLPLRDAEGLAQASAIAAHQPLLRDPPGLWTELVDLWGRRHVARLEPDATVGRDGVLFDTGLVRARRFRSRHRLADGGAAGRPFLGLRAWLVTFDGERRAELTLQLDNTMTGADSLGPVRFQSFALCTDDPDLRFVPLFAGEQRLPPPAPRDGGGFHQWLLEPAERHYLGERTGKTFRLHLFQDGADVDPAERETGAWAPWPVTAFADLAAVRASGAFGAHGGPAPLAEGEVGMAGELLALWRQQGRFGLYGDFGDTANAGAAGAPRNGACALHNVLRWRSAPLLRAAEGMVLQHSLRPTPGFPDRLPADMAEWRRGIGPMATAAPHGFTAPDYEHFSVLLVSDWWWLTGDPFARDELARLGDGLVRLLRGVPFPTCRGEGWCLQSGVLIARATGDDALLAFLRQRVKERILPLLRSSNQVAIAQPPHADVFDGVTAFDAPWQMAALVHGLHALFAATRDEDVRAAALRVADVMAGPGWIERRGPKTFVSAADASRYTIAAMPVDEAGFAVMTIGAFVLATELAVDPVAAERYRACADLLQDRHAPVGDELRLRRLAAANVWLQIALDRRSKNP